MLTSLRLFLAHSQHYSGLDVLHPKVPLRSYLVERRVTSIYFTVLITAKLLSPVGVKTGAFITQS